MALTKQQKVFIGIFVVVLVGLVCDRTLLQPQEADAESAEDLSIERPALSPMTVPSLPTTPVASAAFKERLDGMLPDDQLNLAEARDAFALAGAWSIAQEPSVKRTQVGEFGSRHRLKALILHGKELTAFVDEEFVRIGQTLDGFRLIHLDENSATFEAQGLPDAAQVVLKIDRGRTGGEAAEEEKPF